MDLKNEIKSLVVPGNRLRVTLKDEPGIKYEGTVGEVRANSFVLNGELLNEFEHFSNISADPIYNTAEIQFSDIRSITEIK